MLVGLKRLRVQLANGLGFGIKVRIVAIQPVLTLGGFRSTSCRIRQMLERLMASVCRASSNVATISAKVQRVTSAILLLW